jgi:hypothetical protein
VDNTFKSPGDNVPALVVTANPQVAATIDFGDGNSVSFDPSGKITPKAVSRLVGTLTYVVSFSDNSKSFKVSTCPSKIYKDKAKTKCKSPKIANVAKCTLTVTKKPTGKEFKTFQPFKFGACQVNAAGLAKMKSANVAARPKIILKMDFKPVWPVNGKVKARSSKDGKIYTATRRKGTFAIKLG